MSHLPEGWYTDPEDSAQERYWDGQAWTNDRRLYTPPPTALSAGYGAGQASEPDLPPALSRAMAIPADVRALVKSEQLSVSSAADTNWRTLVQVAAVAVSVTVALTTQFAVAWVLYWAVGSFVAAGAYAAVHEAIHGSLYRSKRANDVAGVVWGVVILNPYASYRSFHFQHHVHARSERDSEPLLAPRSRPEYVITAVFTMLGLNAILWWELLRMLAGMPSESTRRTSRRGLATINLVVQVVALAGLWFATGSFGTLVAAWLVPVVVGSIVAGFISFPKHYGCPTDTSDPLRNTRTVHTGPLTRFAVWNANYHTAHHLAPTVTGRNLPRLQEAIEDRCDVVVPSYRAFHRSALASLRAEGGRATPTLAMDDDIIDLRDGSGYDALAGNRVTADAER